MSVTAPMNIGMPVAVSVIINTKGRSRITSFISSGGIAAPASILTAAAAAALVPC